MKVESFGLRKVLKKVIYFFIIDLQKRTIDIESLPLLISKGFDIVKELIDSSWDESRMIFVWNQVLKERILMLLFISFR